MRNETQRQMEVATDWTLMLMRPLRGQHQVWVRTNGRETSWQVRHGEVLLVSGDEREMGGMTGGETWQRVTLSRQVFHEAGCSAPDLESKLGGGMVVRSARLSAVLEQMQREGHLRDAYAGVALGLLTRLLALELGRVVDICRDGKQAPLMSQRQLRAVLDHIEAHLGENIALQDLAQINQWSTHYFCRMFKRMMNMSPHQYILHRRVERAKEMLTNESIELACVALEVGFGSQSHFGATFRRLAGCTPRAFRQMAA